MSEDVARARALLIERRIEPLLRAASDAGNARSADDDAILRRIARGQIVGFLANRLKVSREEAEPERLSLEQCRAAWAALIGIPYCDLRTWAQHGEAAFQKRRAPCPKPSSEPSAISVRPPSTSGSSEPSATSRA